MSRATKKSTTRTEFIVQNIYSHLLNAEFVVPQISAQSNIEHHAFNIWKEEVDLYKSLNDEALFKLYAPLDITVNNATYLLNSLSNEVFSEGITWCRITTLFVLTTEICAYCFDLEGQLYIVGEIYEWLIDYTTKHLEMWVICHGGWEGLNCFPDDHDRRLDEAIVINAISQYRGNSWTKNVFHGAIKFFGILALIANTFFSNHIVSCKF